MHGINPAGGLWTKKQMHKIIRRKKHWEITHFTFPLQAKFFLMIYILSLNKDIFFHGTFCLPTTNYTSDTSDRKSTLLHHNRLCRAFVNHFGFGESIRVCSTIDSVVVWAHTSVDLRGSMLLLVSTVKDLPFLLSILQRVVRNCVDMKQ